MIGGFQIGYNYQVTPWLVLGAEADIQGLAASNGGANFTGASSGAGVSYTTIGKAVSNLQYIGTVRGRVGYAFDRVMPYVTGGYAGGNEKITTSTGNSSGWRNGYALGGGVDYAITNNVSARVEGLYVGLENKNVSTLGKVGNDIGLIRTGVNYKF